MALKTRSDGPTNARIMIVGEAPGAQEEMKGVPFVGSSGEELTRMLHDAGIVRKECFLSNVTKYRPFKNEIAHFFNDGFTPAGSLGKMLSPKEEILEGIRELANEIRTVRPNAILACGNLPFWALCNRPSPKAGITSWRGSELYTADYLATMREPLGHRAVVIPTYHPANILRQWENRAIAVHDIRARLKKYVSAPIIKPPAYEFILRPSYDQALNYLRAILSELDSIAADSNSIRKRRLSVDIETRSSHIACIGIAVSKLSAICIPLMCIEREEGYWLPEEETQIIYLLRSVLTHPRAMIVGQNFLYDAQHFARHYGFVPRLRSDTMLKQHVAYSGMPKGLDFLSSMYCEFHRFWKEDGKYWDPKMPEEQLWAYNCTDAVVTYEVDEELDLVIDKLQLRSQYNFQLEIWWHMFYCMLRGVAIDKKHRNELTGTLLSEMMQRENERTFICGHPLNPSSSKQMRAFFYDDLNIPRQYSRKNKNPDGSRKVTLDNEALEAIVRKEPLLRGLIQNIAETRSLGVFLSTFVQARLGSDGRMRCYFNPAGAETYRFSSSEDAFGSGTNLQNVPKGLEDEETIELTELVQYKLPNIRKLFVPDLGYTIFDVDLAGADAQVVAWEAHDDVLKEIFRKKLKLHVENGKMMYGPLMGADGKREPYYTRVKKGVHMSNYGATPNTLSKAINISMHEAEKFQHRWFDMHPGIREWQRAVDAQLQSQRMVTNLFGYRRYYFGRIEELLPEALAWVPQSTVALTANQGLANLRPRLIELPTFAELAAYAKLLYDAEIKLLRERLHALGVQLLLQVHDSLVGQYPTRYENEVLPLLNRALSVTIPYPDPLRIPWGLKTSTISWGDAEDRKWPELTTVKVPLPTGSRPPAVIIDDVLK